MFNNVIIILILNYNWYVEIIIREKELMKTVNITYLITNNNLINACNNVLKIIYQIVKILLIQDNVN